MSQPPTSYNLSIADGRSIKRRILTNSGLLGGSRVAAALMGVATLIITARTLDNQTAFGTVLFIHAYMLFFSEIASLQLWQAIIRFGTDDVHQDRPKRFGQLIKTSLILDALCALAAFLMAVSCFGLYIWARGLMGLSGDTIQTELIGGVPLKTMIWTYCLVILFRQTGVSIGALRLFDKFNILALRALVMPAARLIGVIIAYYQGWGIVGILSVWFTASLLSYLVLQIFAAWELMRRRLHPFILRAKFAKSADMIGFYPFAIKSSIDSTLHAFKAYFPTLLIMVFLGPAIVAIYRIAEEIARLLSRGAAMFDQVLYPELTRLIAERRMGELFKLTRNAAMGLGAICFALTLIVIIWGDALIKTGFQDGYDGTSKLAAMLLIAATLLSISVPYYSMLYGMKKIGRVILFRAAGILICALVFALTFKLWGVYAAGWAMIASAFIEVVLAMMIARKVVKAASE